MKKSIWTIALSLILFVTACGKAKPVPANENLITMTMQYKVDLTACGRVASYAAVGWEWPHPTTMFPGPEIVVYTNTKPLISAGEASRGMSISLPEYYWTDIYQDQRVPPVVNGPFSAINITMSGGEDFPCLVTWQEGEFAVRIRK